MDQKKLTLNDVAALLVQIEPTDLADLARVRESLNDIAECSPPSVQRPISVAIQKIDQIVGGKGSDSSSLLTEVGDLLEKALDEVEKTEEEASVSGPEPDQEPTGKPADDDERFDSVPAEANPALLADPVIVEAVKAENAKGKTLDQIKELDAKWMATPGIADYMKVLMDSECGKYLRSLQQSAPYYAEIFVMDNQGANVAMTDKTSDYW